MSGVIMENELFDTEQKENQLLQQLDEFLFSFSLSVKNRGS
jgi:hypothetical protein